MHRLVLLRHGESNWDGKNCFTGWTGVELSAAGVEEPHRAGRRLREQEFTIDAS